MNILALDTATEICGVAITNKKTLLAEKRINRKNIHNETLVQSVQELLDCLGLALTEIDAIAVSDGPGSFTGLRIGLSVAKGFAFATKLQVVPINTLEVLAAGLPAKNEPVAVVLKSRESECYLGRFEANSNTSSRNEIVRIDELENFIDKKTLLSVNPAQLAEELSEKGFNVAAPEFLLSCTAKVAELAYDLLKAGQQIENVASLEPVYLSDFKPKKGKSLFVS